MDKKTLLYTIADLELDRLRSLSREELVQEAQDWFIEADDWEQIEKDTSEKLIGDIIEDYMAYREQESEEELEELITRIKDIV